MLNPRGRVTATYAIEIVWISLSIQVETNRKIIGWFREFKLSGPISALKQIRTDTDRAVRLIKDEGRRHCKRQ
jgi:hypothetical protein